MLRGNYFNLNNCKSCSKEQLFFGISIFSILNIQQIIYEMSNNLIVEFFLKYKEFKLFVVQLKLGSVMINNVVSILMKLMKTS